MRHHLFTIIPATCVLCVAACSGEGSTGAAAGIEPGVGIGPVAVGDRYAELGLGEPAEAITVARQSLLKHPDLGLELVLASSLDAEVSGDAYVLAVAAEPGSGFEGPAAPGMARADIEAALGAPDFEAGGIGFWTEGVSVVWDGDVARRVAVFAPFDLEPEMPEMLPATGGGS